MSHLFLNKGRRKVDNMEKAMKKIVEVTSDPYAYVEGLKEEKIEVKPRAGRGIGAVEAPRGILFHDYTYDDKGIIQSANCVIPTNQNHNNIQKDFESLVPQMLSQPQDKVRLTLEMLVRAYDPCISCSAHLIDLS